MNGLELSRAFFEAYGRPMLDEQFPDLLPRLAAGLIGSGSECFGYDDAVSRDHDFEPGFCLFLPGEDVVDRRTAFLLERAYAKLPKEFMGLRRSLMQPVGGPRRGILRTGEFFAEKLSAADGALTVEQWLTVPEQSLAECTNGVLFFDNCGEVTRIREGLRFFPEDVRRKKLAGHLLLMAQAGQYNYQRCIRHGESAAAQLAVGEFVRSTISAVFLLNRQYQPYYKWSFRALRALPKLSLLAELLEYLLTSDNEATQAQEKYDVIESIAADVIDELMEQELTNATCGDLEKHAYSVNDGIADAGLRNLHVLAAV
ncbi:MAG: DUF4037 domain-containing protein [Ruminococcaceae bacterium]|jgi:hypothetical protein|nr:DUF4037 domain-containing protein [Oscillospiraceae bacterium]